MSIYHRFCDEILDSEGKIQKVNLHYPENFNFAYDVIDILGEETPRKKALVWCNTENQEHIFTFADLKDGSSRMANMFQKAGIGRGDKVMLILKRHYEYWFAVLALHKLGAVALPATHMLTEDDIAYRVKTARVKAVVSTIEDGMPQKIRTALEQEDLSPKLFSVKGQAEGFQELMPLVKEASPDFPRQETLAEDPMLLYFTSGTTGQPKGVFHDFAYPLAHIVTAKYWQQAQEDGLHFTVAETGWAKASWGKMYGQWLVGSAVMVYDFDNFDPRQLVDVINHYGVTSFCAPPTVYRYLVRKGIPAMPTLRHATTAGEMLAPQVFREFTQQTGLPLCEGYGQTETTLLMGNLKGFEPEEGSMGTPSPLYHIELHDREGNPVESGETGEVVILPEGGKRPVGVFSGYLDQEEQYQKAWRNGVYHTGDAARRDEQGRYWFCGRFDDIIKTGGFRVGPDEVEHVLMEHPGVAACSVVGVPDPLRGQSIKAFVSLAGGYTPSANLAIEIKNFSNKKLAEYKWIRTVEFVEQMPRTISGKIQRKLLALQ